MSQSSVEFPPPPIPLASETVPARQRALTNKTLGLCRRLLVGNGWRIKDLKVSCARYAEHDVQSKLTLTCVPTFKIARSVGRPSEATKDPVFSSAEEARAYHEAHEKAVLESAEWQAEAIDSLILHPTKGWHAEGLMLPLKLGAFTLHVVSVCKGCQGRAKEDCPSCQNIPSGDGKACKTCKGEGVVPCGACAGTGCETETVTVSFAAKVESSVITDLAVLPSGIQELLDKVAPENLVATHADISLVAHEEGEAKTSSFSQILTLHLPDVDFVLHAKDKAFPFKAYGFGPVFEKFPPLLDDVFAPLIPKISAQTLPSWLDRVRLFREIAQALAMGETLRDFFLRRYPYGLSPRIALELATRIKNLFFATTFVPRMIATMASLGVVTVAYYIWLYNPRPDFLPAFVPIWFWDMALLGVFSCIPFLAVAFAAEKSLHRLIGLPVDLRAAGGAWATTASVIGFLICFMLLFLPDTRPEWLYALLP